MFGYGSLMWNPGFAFEDKMTARAFGYRRSLCVRSYVHRGTPERPGLVLGLDHGGSCRGMAFKVALKDKDDVIGYLRERELVTHVYLERTMPVLLADGRRVARPHMRDRPRPCAICWCAERRGRSRDCGRFHGKSGPNTDYLVNTLAHLKQMGIRDHWLEEVAALVERKTSQA